MTASRERYTLVSTCLPFLIPIEGRFTLEVDGATVDVMIESVKDQPHFLEYRARGTDKGSRYEAITEVDPNARNDLPSSQ